MTTGGYGDGDGNSYGDGAGVGYGYGGGWRRLRFRGGLMRIISNFRDYYDTVAGPQDKTDFPVYMRREQQYERSLPHPEQVTPLVNLVRRLPCVRGVRQSVPGWTSVTLFGFCGRLRVAFVPYHGFGLGPASAYGTLTEMAADFAWLAEALDKAEVRERRIWGRNAGLASLRRLEARSPTGPLSASRALDEFLPEILAAHPTHDLHRLLGAPIFSLRHMVGRGIVLTVNPCLSPRGMLDVSYTSLFGDPRAVYQEIEMYLGTHLAQQVDPVPARTDDLIRDAHGFDKLSFRHGRPDRRARKQR